MIQNKQKAQLTLELSDSNSDQVRGLKDLVLSVGCRLSVIGCYSVSLAEYTA